MNYQLFAADMDGTVLNSQKIITSRTRAAILAALDAGYEVLFATGRSYSEVKPYLKDFPQMHYLLTVSGASVVDLRAGKSICRHPFSPGTVEKVLAALSGTDVMISHFVGEEVYLSSRFRGHFDDYGCGCYTKLGEDCAMWLPDASAFCLEHTEETYKLNAFFRYDEDFARATELLKDFDVTLARALKNNYEISPKGVSKATGLTALCEYIGLPIAQAIAIGDEGNDVEMLRAAGLGVAMGNAIDAAKAAARVTVADCDHDGVAEAIETYLGKECV